MSVDQFVKRAFLFLGVMLAAIPSGRAATSTASISVSAVVSPTCRLGSPTEPAGPEARAHRLAVTCETSVPYTLTYDESSMPRTGAITGADDATPGRVATTITY